MLVKRDINHHSSVKVKVGAVSTCPIPSVQISFIISQPCNQLNCIGQQCNLMGVYWCTVQPCGMYYETILPVEKLNCEYVLNQTSNTRKIYVLFFNGDVSVYSATMYYESMLLFEVSPATNCEHLLNQTPYTCKIYVLFATPFKMGRFEILVPPAKSEMETENLSVSARQG